MKRKKKPGRRLTGKQILGRIVRIILVPITLIMTLVGMIFANLFMTLDYMLVLEDKGTYTSEEDAAVQMTDDWDPNESIQLSYLAEPEENAVH